MKPAGAACEECPLKERECVYTEHNRRAQLAIVGEGPGQKELQEGKPFVGPSGKYLEQLHTRVLGKQRKDFIWTNAALCEAHSDKELRAAAKQCSQRLIDDLRGVTFIITVGGHALQRVLGLSRKPSIMKYRGTVIRKGDQVVLPTLHPAFILRDKTRAWAPVVIGDFERIRRVITDGWLPPERLDGRRRIVVKSVEALERELSEMPEEVSIDVETTEDPAMHNRMICFAITGGDGEKTVVVPWSIRQNGRGRYFAGRQREAARIVTEVLADRISVTHNGPAFDHIVLARHGIKVGEWEDTLVAHHAFMSHMPQRLDHVVSVYLDVPPWKQQEARHKELSHLYRYNSQDTLYTALAWQEMQDDLEAEKQVYEIDRRSSLLCRDMQVNGFRYDKAHAEELASLLKKKIRRAKKQAQDAVGREFNPASNKQLREVFFNDLQAPVFFIAEKTGNPVLNIDALRAYATYADEKLQTLSNAIIDFRKASKILGTYIKPIITDRHDRVHPSWHCYGTVSGRYACRQPNLMNLPRPENDPAIDLGGIRSLYVASPGCQLVYFDCGQLEMRIAAYISGDEVMISACETDDLHSANAALLFPDEFDPKRFKQLKKKEQLTDSERNEFGRLSELRTIAKQSGFAIAYLAGAETVYNRIVATGVEMTMAGAEALVSMLHERFHAYYSFQNDLLMQTIRTGHVRTPIIGRKRYVGHNPDVSLVANYPVQGGAADHLNLLLPRIDDRRPKRVRMVAQIHDAAIYDTPDELVDEMKAIVIEEAARPVKLGDHNVVFPIDLKVAERWSDT